MTTTATQVCYLCGAPLASGSVVTVTGPPQAGPGMQVAPVLRICRRHVVAEALFARMNRRQRQIVVATALADNRPRPRDWRPVVRSRLVGNGELGVGNSEFPTPNSPLTPEP